MKVHPVAKMFPMLEDAELQDLAESIRTNGLREPIVTHNGALLDGRNRLAACKLAGVDPEFVEYSGDDPIAFIVDANLRRRHLKVGQRGMLATDLLPHLEKEAKKRHVEGSRRGGLDLGSKAPENSPEGSEARQQAARLTGVSDNTVSRAKRLASEAPKLAKEVREGRKSMNAAYTEAFPPKDPDRVKTQRRNFIRATELLHDVAQQVDAEEAASTWEKEGLINPSTFLPEAQAFLNKFAAAWEATP